MKMTVNMELVNGCTEHCASCVHEDRLRFMNESVFNSAMRVIDPDNVEQYRLYGNGESMLHPSLLSLLKQLPAAVPSILKTNGVVPFEDYVGVAPLVGKLLICLDGMTQECHGLTRTSNATEIREKAISLSKIAPNVGLWPGGRK
jgi:hypothetical protein